jgi:hypothetical protein
LSVFSRRDNLGNNPGGELAPFFFFFVGVIRFVHNCAVVTEGKDDNGRDDKGGNDDDEKDRDDDDNCRFDSDDAVFRNFFLAAILDSLFLTFFGGVTIEVDALRPLEGLSSDGDQFLIVFAMVLILCCVVFFLEEYLLD